MNTYDITKLATGISVSLVGRVAARGLAILGHIMLARLLGPRQFGLYAIGWTVLILSGAIVPFGLHNGVIHFISRHQQSDPTGLKSILLQALGLVLLSGTLIGGGLYFAAPWIAEHVFQEADLILVLRWIALALPLSAGFIVASATIQASQRMKFSAYGEVTLSAANLFLIVLLVSLLGWELFGAVVAIVVSFAIAFGLALYYAKYLFPEAFSAPRQWGSLSRELIIFSLPTAFIGTVDLLSIQADRLFIGYYRSTTEVGIYYSASQSVMLFSLIVSVFNTVVAPMIASLYAKREMGQLEELFRISTKWGLYLTLPIFLVICFAPEEIILVLFGSKYASGRLILVILAIGQLINIGTGPLDLLLIMTGHQRHCFMIAISMLIVNVALNCLLIPLIGLTGAALATTGTTILHFLAGLIQTKLSLGLWPYDRRYLKVILATLIVAIVLFLLRIIVVNFWSPFLTLLLIGTVSISMFVIVLLMLGLNDEDKECLSLAREMLNYVKIRLAY